MPTSIKDMATYVVHDTPRFNSETAERFADVLITLDGMGGECRHSKGLASNALFSHTATMTDLSRKTQTDILNRLTSEGWVWKEVRGRRTYKIKLLHPLPADASKWMEGVKPTPPKQPQQSQQSERPEPNEGTLPVPLKAITVYRDRQAAFQDLLVQLHLHGGRVESQGMTSATTVWKGWSTIERIREMGPGGFVNMVDSLAKADWIELERRGKRTPWIRLKHPLPAEWLPAEDDVEQLELAPAETPPVEDVPVVHHVVGAPAHTFTNDEIEQLIDSTHDVLATPIAEPEEDLGMRPGRLAARIEKSIPDLVKAATRETFVEMIGGIVGVLGIPTVNTEEHEAIAQHNERLIAENARLRSQTEDLIEEVRRMGALLDYQDEQEDARLIKSNEGQFTGPKEGLTVSQVPDVYRNIARHAMENGWSLRRTRGGHLAWRSPAGKTIFSPSTPSVHAQPQQVLWRKLRRAGLPDFNGRVQEFADIDRWSNLS